MKKRFYSLEVMHHYVHHYLIHSEILWLKKSLLSLVLLLAGMTNSYSQFQTIFVDPAYNLCANDINEVSTGYIMCSEVSPFAASAGITTEDQQLNFHLKACLPIRII